MVVLQKNVPLQRFTHVEQYTQTTNRERKTIPLLNVWMVKHPSMMLQKKNCHFSDLPMLNGMCRPQTEKEKPSLFWTFGWLNTLGIDTPALITCKQVPSPSLPTPSLTSTPSHLT